MKLLEWMLNFYVHKMVSIDTMNFGFVPGRNTTDTILIVHQLQEKCIASNKPLYFASVDLEKAFDRVQDRPWGASVPGNGLCIQGM